MVDPAAMIQADKITLRHVLSARPDASVIPEPPPRQRGQAFRLAAGAALRRLADRIEPKRVASCG